jgi:hypothetical protein
VIQGHGIFWTKAEAEKHLIQEAKEWIDSRLRSGHSKIVHNSQWQSGCEEFLLTTEDTSKEAGSLLMTVTRYQTSFHR